MGGLVFYKSEDMRKLYGRLIIKIESATNLPNSDYFNGLSDPYCIVLLDDTEIGRTQVCQDCANPVWNEELILNLNGEGENIVFNIWDEDTARRDDLLATVSIPVSSIASVKPTDEEQCSSNTIDLKNSEGEPTGTLSYSMKLREFGGEFAQFKNDGEKKALQIGINYVNKQLGKGGVVGCHEDIEIMQDLLTSRYGFSEENMTVLKDEEGCTMPTRRNIERAIKKFVSTSRPGDSLVFQYSGHGGQVKDHSGDEKDGYDETILPYDHEKAGQITDDDLFKMLVKPLPHGVLLTCVMDCCHSGTSVDLPFVHLFGDESNEGEDNSTFDDFVEKSATAEDSDAESREFKPEVISRGGGFKPDKMARLKRKRRARHRVSNKSSKNYDNTSSASVVMISGCMDEQVSKGTNLGGAMVMAFSKALNDANGDITYRELVVNMREILKQRGFDQIPLLSTARPFNLDCKVII